MSRCSLTPRTKMFLRRFCVMRLARTGRFQPMRTLRKLRRICRTHSPSTSRSLPGHLCTHTSLRLRGNCKDRFRGCVTGWRTSSPLCPARPCWAFLVPGFEYVGVSPLCQPALQPGLGKCRWRKRFTASALALWPRLCVPEPSRTE